MINCNLENKSLIKIATFLVAVSISNIILSQNFLVQPYLQNVDTSEVTIMWETDVAGAAFVEWGTTPFDLINTQNSSSQVGNQNSRIHTATIANLNSDSKYYYKVITNSGSSTSLYNFKTYQHYNAESSTRLAAISDMQRDGSNPNVFQEIIEDGIIEIVQTGTSDINDELDALLIPGDLVTTGGTYNQWKDFFFEPSDSLSPYVPFYPVLGNHEYQGNGKPNFVKYFDLPDNGHAANPDEWWYKDISNTRIIGLNSNSGGAEQDTQLVWLQEVLDSTANRDEIDFVFAQLHHPYKSELWTPGENDFTGEVIEKLENFSTDSGKPSVHFFGHTHAYSRGQSRDHSHLWVNVATAGGAIDNWGEFPNADYEEFVKSQDEYGFVILDIEAGSDPSFTLKRYSTGDSNTSLSNELRDEITINRYDDQPETPVCLFPYQQEINPACFELKASNFEDPNNDTHQASHWQIATDSADFQNHLVFDQWKQNENWYNEVNTQELDTLSDELPNVYLESDSSYYWRVRYRDEHLKWSDWSDRINFTTSESNFISGNLLQNGGAESSINNWQGDIESLQSNECNSIPSYAGDYLFAVGGICTNEMAFGTAYQIIDLSGYSGQITQGNIDANFSAFMRNYSGADIPSIKIEALDSNQDVLQMSNTLSTTNDAWQNYQSTMNLPSNTEFVKFILEGTRNAGTDNDSYFDEISLKLIESSDCSLHVSCPQTRILTTVITGQSQWVQVQDTIQSTAILQGDAKVRYESGMIIEINPGFDSKLGSTFDAIIKNCEID